MPAIIAMGSELLKAMLLTVECFPSGLSVLFATAAETHNPSANSVILGAVGGETIIISNIGTVYAVASVTNLGANQNSAFNLA